MMLPLASVPLLKNVTKRQSKSFSTVFPTSQSPSACVGGISVAVTVTVNEVLTSGSCNCSVCALGSVQGVAGVGFALDGQSKTACCAGGFVPTGNVRFCDAGGGRKSAVTASGEFIVTMQLVAMPKLAQAPPQPPKVEGAVRAAV